MRRMKFSATALLLCSAVFVSAQGDYSLEAAGAAQSIINKHPGKPSEYPRTQDTVIGAPQFKYEINSRRVATTFVLDTIRPAKITNDPIKKLYRTYLRAGYGTYNSVYGEGYFSMLRSKSWNAGIYAKHFSINHGVDDVAGFSGMSQNAVTLYGKHFLKKHTLSGDLGYDRDVVHFYGSTADTNTFTSDAIVQRYNWFGGGLRLQSHYTDQSKINHDVKMRYFHFGDIYNASENNFVIGGSGYGFLNTEKIAADIGIDYNNNKTAKDTVSSTIFKIQPAFIAKGKRFEAMIGMGLYSDIRSEDTRTYFFPQAEFSFDVFKHYLVPYAGITGNLERNSYRSLTQLNPFMLPAASAEMRNTQNRNLIYAGLKGSISSSIAYSLKISHQERRNMALFVNASELRDYLQNKFDVIYDTVDVTTLHGEIQFLRNEKIRVLAKADYHIYSAKNQLKAWHNPAINTGISALYRVPDTKAGLDDKITARADVFWIGPQFARTVDSTGAFVATELKGAVDANIALEYRYTKFLSFFVHFNNLASQRYYRWNEYPTQRFNVMGGLSYAF
ncbi:MAG: hypothetical protein FD123_3064 [Bacteroidetes bacterium]|nr:MAG: hypothetical protein FD123_3064 [Bacteroidota bacterium]